jgi:hypothetical protein
MGLARRMSSRQAGRVLGEWGPMRIEVNGKHVSPAPVIVIAAPLQPIPNLPPGYIEKSRWTDGTGTTTIRCWPEDTSSTRMEDVA